MAVLVILPFVLFSGELEALKSFLVLLILLIPSLSFTLVQVILRVVFESSAMKTAHTRYLVGGCGGATRTNRLLLEFLKDTVVVLVANWRLLVRVIHLPRQHLPSLVWRNRSLRIFLVSLPERTYLGLLCRLILLNIVYSETLAPGPLFERILATLPLSIFFILQLLSKCLHL